ncbi:hypothetical protein H9L13_00760 [Sphingomonas lutea]|uniref:Uncharacterized protein n=1 Tax=Sphingomonas lutea TaxID=1045317 RepID=A0A7G9SI55_9SPHN|nr:hypothetical protein [Sphingomonas lutea]QNN67530.1 hypothetical protein H9L13_00760 [Sphingomonas lutea]
MILPVAFLLAAAAPTTSQVIGQVECAARSGTEAQLCLATEYSRSGRFAESAAEFEKAAASAGPRADFALAAAGNMWIAAGQPGKAAFALDRALAGKSLVAEQRGEALLDRARAAEAQNDLATARARLKMAEPLIAQDPFYWYFSAALAIREGDRAVAQSAIGKALALAPNDPTVLFEAGHVADFLGNADQARSYWMRAAGNDPNGPIGKAAAKAVEMMGVTPVVKSQAQTPK